MRSASGDAAAQMVFRVIPYLFFGFVANERLRVSKRLISLEELPAGRLRIGLLMGSL